MYLDRNQIGSTRDKTFVKKMLGDWAGSSGQEEDGVSIESAFFRYDKDKSGTIDLSELAVLLEDLGVNPTEERLHSGTVLNVCTGINGLCSENSVDLHFYALQRFSSLTTIRMV